VKNAKTEREGPRVEAVRGGDIHQEKKESLRPAKKTGQGKKTSFTQGKSCQWGGSKKKIFKQIIGGRNDER